MYFIQYGIYADVHIRQDSRPAERQIVVVHVGLLLPPSWRHNLPLPAFHRTTYPLCLCIYLFLGFNVLDLLCSTRPNYNQESRAIIPVPGEDPTQLVRISHFEYSPPRAVERPSPSAPPLLPCAGTFQDHIYASETLAVIVRQNGNQRFWG